MNDRVSAIFMKFASIYDAMFVLQLLCNVHFGYQGHFFRSKASKKNFLIHVRFVLSREMTVYTTLYQRLQNTAYVLDNNRDFASRSSNVDATSASAGSMLPVKGKPRCHALRRSDSNPEEESQSENYASGERERERANRVSRRAGEIVLTCITKPRFSALLHRETRRADIR